MLALVNSWTGVIASELPSTGEIKVVYDPTLTHSTDILEKLAQAGYLREPNALSELSSHSQRMGSKLQLLASLVLGWQWCWEASLLTWLAWPLLRNTWLAPGLHQETLVCLGALGCLVLDDWQEGIWLVLLYRLGYWLERHWVAKSLVPRIISSLPSKRWEESSWTDVMSHEIRPGDRLLICTGATLPVDGELLAGTAQLDLSHLTGESLPQSRTVGETLPGGGVNLGSPFEVQARSTFSESTYGRMARQVEQALKEKSLRQGRLERWAHAWLKGLFAAGMFIFGIQLGAGVPSSTALYNSLAMLLVGCPCALVLAAPIAYAVVLRKAAQRGCPLKNSQTIENLASVRNVFFDKTGTLTESEFELLEFDDQDDFLQLAASLEQGSLHPFARCLLAAAKERGISNVPITQATYLPGFGMSGLWEGRPLEIGRDLSSNQGHVGLWCGGQLLTRFRFQSKLRASAKSAIDQLRSQGIRLVILSGDGGQAVERVAQQLGVDEYHAQLLPECKCRIIGQNAHSLMVGDGINDAKALAKASCAVVLKSNSGEGVSFVADCVLEDNDLRHLPWLLKLSREALATIKFNVAFALVSKLAALSLVWLGLAGLSLAVAADVGVTVFVVLNSLRLEFSGPNVAVDSSHPKRN